MDEETLPIKTTKTGMRVIDLHGDLLYKLFFSTISESVSITLKTGVYIHIELFIC